MAYKMEANVGNELQMPAATEQYYPQQPMMVPPSITADLIEKIDPKRVCDEISHKLRGETWDAENDTWVREPGSKPYLNAEGVWRITSIASQYINNNTIYSDLDNKEIEKLMIKLSLQLIALLRTKYVTFEIDKADLTTIKNLVLTTTFISLKRSLHGGERTFTNKSISETIVSQPESPYMADARRKRNIFKFWK